MAPSIVRHGNITWRVNEQHKRIAENNARTRALIDSQNRRQLEAERDTIVSHIHKLSPGARKVYLTARQWQTPTVRRAQVRPETWRH